MRRFVTREAAWVALLVVLAGWWGGRYVRTWREAGRPQIFYQEYFEPALMIACGRGFAIAEGRPPVPVVDFITQKSDRFECALLPPDLATRSTGLYQYAWFYLMWMVGLFWEVFGVSWSGLVPLFGALFALVIGLSYAVFRMAVPPWVAWPAAAALGISTLHLQNLPHLRDYAKAPFVIGLLLMLFAMVKRPTTKRVLVLSALYGFVIGIGYGFRADFLANIPPLFLTVLVFVPGFSLRELGAKLAALAVAATLFIGASWPAVSYVVQQGGCQFHVILVGLEHNFNLNLGVAPSYYGWIPRLSDEFIHASINSYLYRTAGAPPVPYCTSEYDAASGAYLTAIASNFPADMLTRAYASTLRVMDMPFYLWGTGPDTTLSRSRIGELLTHVVGTARLAVVISLLLLGAASWRLGLFALAIVLYFGGYPSLQFGSRHFFHLEFIGWFAMAFVFWQIVRLARWAAGRADAPWPGTARAFGGQTVKFAAVVALVVFTPLPVVRAYQDGRFASMRDSLIAAPRVAMPYDVSADGTLLVTAPLEVDPADRTHTAYLDVRIDLAACPAGVPLVFQYDRSNPIYDYSSAVQPQPYHTVPERILMPVFRGFTGLGLAGAPASCVSSVERLQSVRGLPLLPVLTLPHGWESLPPHQQLGPLTRQLWGYGR